MLDMQLAKEMLSELAEGNLYERGGYSYVNFIGMSKDLCETSPSYTRQACHWQTSQMKVKDLILTTFSHVMVRCFHGDTFQEDLRDYYSWLVNESPWAECFVFKDLDFLLNYGSVIDTTVAPSNIVSGALIASRRPYDSKAFLINWHHFSKVNTTSEKLYTLLWCDLLPTMGRTLPAYNPIYGHNLFDVRYFYENVKAIKDPSLRYLATNVFYSVRDVFRTFRGATHERSPSDASYKFLGRVRAARRRSYKACVKLASEFFKGLENE